MAPVKKDRKNGLKTRRQFMQDSAGSAAAISTAALWSGRSAAAQSSRAILLDGALLGRTFEGIGALSAGASSRLLIDYPEPHRSRVLDLLFQPKFGASLHHLKVEIGGDVNSTDGVEPSHMHTRGDENYDRGYEWWLMKEAKARNPEIILDCLAWGAPGWIGKGKYYSRDMTDYIIKFIKGARDHHGLTMDYVGIWNETNYDIAWIKLLSRELRANGLATKIVAADQTVANSKGMWGPARDMCLDPELREAIDVVGVHYPAIYRGCRSPWYARKLGRPLWDSEEGWSQKRLVSSDYATALFLARAFNLAYIRGRMTKTVIWALVTSYCSNLPFKDAGLMRANEPWSGYHEVHPPIWATAHTTQFCSPGWKYLAGPACGSLPEGGSLVALKSPDTDDYSLILETGGAKAGREVAFNIGRGLSTAPVRVWRTNRNSQFQQLDEIKPRSGRISLVLEPDSIYSATTTRGQSKGEALPAERKSFPMPYRDDFSTYAPGATARYFSDWSGVFETQDRPDGPGRCLGQVIVGEGIAWHFARTGTPLTVIGGPEAADYTVSVDSMIKETKGWASLFGRVQELSMNPLVPSPIKGYELRVGPAGQWQLLAQRQKLAEGSTTRQSGRWINLKLEFKGDEITALINNQGVALIRSGQFAKGMAGLGCGRHRAWFANFSIE